MRIETSVIQQAKLDLSGSVAPFELVLPDMPASVWASPEHLRSRFHREAARFLSANRCWR